MYVCFWKWNLVPSPRLGTWPAIEANPPLSLSVSVIFQHECLLCPFPLLSASFLSPSLIECVNLESTAFQEWTLPW